MAPKSEKKKQEKIIQDRTFGLKNKNKSKAVQKFVKGVEQTVKFNGKSAGMLESEEFEQRKLKKKQEEQAALLKSLYNDVNRMREDEESQEEDDPSTTVCPYFKQGLCQKGKNCIYSHDLTLDRNEEIDLYVDQRTQLLMNSIGGKELSQMTEDELSKAIGDKEKSNVKGCKSDIVCKYFLDAAENNRYGWKWNCPNGDGCIYKHCLPLGYKLKRDLQQQAKQDQEDVIPIELIIDEQRNMLLAKNQGSPLVTYEVFMKWKEAKRLRREIDADKKKKDETVKRKGGLLRTGKELFNENPNLFVDDEQAAAQYVQEELPEEEEEELQGEGQNQDGEGEEQGEGQDQENQDENQQKQAGAEEQQTGAQVPQAD